MAIPNMKILTEPWYVITKDILYPKNTTVFIKNVVYLAKALGEINRYYSKKLTDGELITLHQRMTKLRGIVRKLSAVRREQGKDDLIPWQYLEYLYSGEDRKDMKR